jgi:hypothetical protein
MGYDITQDILNEAIELERANCVDGGCECTLGFCAVHRCSDECPLHITFLHELDCPYQGAMFAAAQRKMEMVAAARWN